MISLSPTVIKYLIGVAAIAAIVLYGNHVIKERDKYKSSYETETKLRQETANVLLAERLNSVQMAKEAKEIEDKLNEIAEQNTKYRNCVANRTCYVSLRQQAPKTTYTSSTTPGINNGTQNSIDIALQQDIFDLRASIERDELIIKKLQQYIIQYCPNTSSASR